MAYFSNGTEGMDYVDQWCSNCVHDENEDCPIWNAHLQFSYGAEGQAESILNMLIPRSKDGLSNEQCTMFLRKAAVDDLFNPPKAAKPNPYQGIPWNLPDTVTSRSVNGAYQGLSQLGLTQMRQHSGIFYSAPSGVTSNPNIRACRDRLRQAQVRGPWEVRHLV